MVSFLWRSEGRERGLTLRNDAALAAVSYFKRQRDGVGPKPLKHRNPTQLAEARMTSLEYLLTTGVMVTGFLSLCYALLRAIHYSMVIKAHVMSLPLG